MRTISFYSFKGGVGRTSLVLNLAYELASRAQFVVVADWDLHAPGLSLMDDLAMPRGPFPRKGILDFLASALPPLDSLPSSKPNAEVIDPYHLAQPTMLAQRSRQQSSFGDIYFIPAGSFDSESNARYPATLRQLRLPDLVTWRAKLPGRDEEQSVLGFFKERIESLRSEVFGKDYPPDFLLLDSRTGITEIGDLLLGNPVDHYVVLFGLNEQNQTGMEMVVREVQRAVPPGNLLETLSLVISPVPVGEEDLLRERMQSLAERLRRMARVDTTGKSEAMPALLRIPYHPRLALREEIIIERYPDSTLASTYKDIASHVLGRERAIERVEASTREVLAEVPSDQSLRFLQFNDRYLVSVDTENQTVRAPRSFSQPPSWNWPSLALKPHDMVRHTETASDIETLLNSMCWSASLRAKEKERVLLFAATLPSPRLARLAEPFAYERTNWAESWDTDWLHIESNFALACVDWIDVLANKKLIDREAFWHALGEDTQSTILPKTLCTPRFLFLVGLELLQAKQSESAKEVLLRTFANSELSLVEARIRSIHSRIANGGALLSREETDALNELFALRPSARSFLNAVGALVKARWTEEARQLADIASNRDVDEVYYWLVLGQQYLEMKQLPSAEAAINRALSLEPSSSSTYAQLAKVLAIDPLRRKDALGAIARAEELASDAGDWRLIAVTYAEELGDYQSAFRTIEIAMLNKPPDITYELEFAEIAIGARCFAQATESLSRVEILFSGPLRREYDPPYNLANYRVVKLVLSLAIALLNNNVPAVEGIVGALLSKRYGKHRWRFSGLLENLKTLDTHSWSLLRSASKFVDDEQDDVLRENLAYAYASWLLQR